MILTSNKSYLEWGKVFGDDVLTTAILDRLLHHAITFNIKGDSYRLREKKKSRGLSCTVIELTVHNGEFHFVEIGEF
jgi:hypothetical protein